MRLIDADALLARYDRIHVGAPGAARKMIEDAPTIDAVPVDKIHFTDLYLDGIEAIAVFKFGNQGITLRKKCEDFVHVVHGRWVKDGDFLICLNCESEIDIKSRLGVENRKNYFPNCGAKMDGEADV